MNDTFDLSELRVRYDLLAVEETNITNIDQIKTELANLIHGLDIAIEVDREGRLNISLWVDNSGYFGDLIFNKAGRRHRLLRDILSVCTEILYVDEMSRIEQRLTRMAAFGIIEIIADFGNLSEMQLQDYKFLKHKLLE